MTGFTFVSLTTVVASDDGFVAGFSSAVDSVGFTVPAAFLPTAKTYPASLL